MRSADTACGLALQKYNPSLYELVINSNGENLKYVEGAIFAVTALGVGGPITEQERKDLCDSVDETLLRSGLEEFKLGEAARVKRYVCGTVED